MNEAIETEVHPHIVALRAHNDKIAAALDKYDAACSASKARLQEECDKADAEYVAAMVAAGVDIAYFDGEVE